VRYVDLEIDVVRRGNEEPFLVDREKLKKITAQGFISPALEERASETAIEVLGLLKESRDR
jgi:predicted RNA-binding protein associated with RNAse of E/G family